METRISQADPAEQAAGGRGGTPAPLPPVGICVEDVLPVYTGFVLSTQRLAGADASSGAHKVAQL